MTLRPNERRSALSDRPGPCAKVEDTLPRVHVGTSKHAFHNRREALVDLPQIDI
jgi:hypothetical protein